MLSKIKLMFPFFLVICIVSLSYGQDSINKSEENSSSKIEGRDIIDIYRQIVAYNIQKNWKFPDTGSKSSSLEARVLFRVLRNGTIKDC